MTQTDWNKYYNVTTQANQAQALNEMVPIEEPEPLVVPQTIERQPTLLEQKIAKLQERDAEKRARVRPEAQTEFQYQIQDWINPVKDVWNTLVPSGLELTRREVEMDPTSADYGREFTLNNATGQREFGGKLIDGEWKTDYVTPEMAHLQGLAGTHKNPMYTKDANNQLIQMDNMILPKDASVQDMKDMIAHLEAERTLTLGEDGYLRLKNGKLINEVDNPKKVYNFQAADGISEKAGISIGYAKDALTGKWVPIPAIARYTPGYAHKLTNGTISESYGWEPGVKGVDTDLTHYSSDFNEADAVVNEALRLGISFKEGTRTLKKGEWDTKYNPKDAKDYGSGKSEYRLKGSDMTGDAARGAELWNKYKASDEYIQTMYNYDTRDLDKKDGMLSEISQSVRGLPGALASGAIDLADAVQEAATYPLQALYNKTQNANIDIDFIGDKAKADTKKSIDKFTGYVAEWDEADQKKAMRQLEAVGFDITKPDTYGKVLEIEGGTKLAQALGTMITNPSMTVQNVAPIIGSAFGLKAGIKTAEVIGNVTAKVAAKSVPNLVSKVQAGGAWTKNALTTEYDKAYTALESAKKLAKSGSATGIEALAKAEARVAKLGFADKIAKLGVGNTMSNADFMVRMNEDITEFKKNNNNEGMDFGKLATAAIINKIGAEWSAYNIKSILKPDGKLTDHAKRVFTSRFDDMMKHVGETAGVAKNVVMGGIKETPQELYDGFAAVLNQDFGSAAYKDKTVQELFSMFSDDIVFGAVAGFAGGAHMGAAGSVGDIKQAYKESSAKRDEAKIKIRNEKDRAERVSYLESKGTDFDKFTPETAVEDADAESSIIMQDTPESEAIQKKITEAENRGAPIEEIEALDDEWIKAQNIVESKLYVSPANLKVEAKDVNDYDRLLGEQRDKVVQSVYEIDPKTKKIKGLTAEAKELMESDPDALQAKVDKVDKWLVSYENEYAKPAQLRDADQSVVDSITDEQMTSNTLTDAQKTEAVLSFNNNMLAKKEPTLKELQLQKIIGEKETKAILDKLAEEGQIEIPQAIKKQVDYFTGYDAKVHLEPLEARRLEMQEAAENEVKAAELKAQIVEKEATITEDNRAEVEAEIEAIQVKVKALETSAETKRMENIDTKIVNDLVKVTENAPQLDKLERPALKLIFKDMLTNANSKVENGTLEYNEGWSAERVEKLADTMSEEKYKINSKYRFDPDPDMALVTKNMNFGVDNGTKKKNTVLDGTKINGNTFADAVINGKVSAALVDAGVNENDSKTKFRVLKKLEVGGANYNIASNIMDKIKNVIESAEGKAKLSEILTDEGIADGEGVILLVTALGAIDAATVTDTQARLNVNAGQNEGLLAKEDYWASESNTITQIGKDFMTARGIKLTRGTPSSHLNTYRKIGRIALELAIEAKLVESTRTNNQHVASVLGKEMKIDTEKNTSITSAPLITDPKTKVSLNLADYGIRIVPEKGKEGQNETDNSNINMVGDTASRLTKLLISNNLEVPKKTANTKEDIQVKSTVQLYKKGSIDILDTVQNFQETAYKLKGSWMNFFKGINEEIGDTSLDVYLSSSKGEWLGEMLGIDKFSTGSAILADTDKGTSNGLKDVLRGILDNLESLEIVEGEDGLHLSYAVGGNRRVIVRETVLNPQNDKVIALNIMQSAKTEDSGYEIGREDSKAYLYTISEMLNALGFKASANAKTEAEAIKEYKAAVKRILTQDKHTPNYLENKELGKGEVVINAIIELMQLKDTAEIAKAINGSKLKGSMGGKKTFKSISIIEGFKVMKASYDPKDNSKQLKTNYIPGSDAKSSGVMITLLNILGYDKATKKGEVDRAAGIQEVLESLGVQLTDTEKDKLGTKDAYNILQEKVIEILESISLDIGSATGAKYGKAKARIAQLEALGIDTRDLSKKPVMTWLYTAGSNSIINKLADYIMQPVMRQAMEGNKAALKQLEEITGKSDLTPAGVMGWKARGKEHLAMLEAYKEIGELYEAQLEAAFPGVVKYKKNMQTIFNKISTLGEGYTNGRVKGSSSGVYGNGGNDYFVIQKDTAYALELDDDVVRGKDELIKAREERGIVSANKLFDNWTSVLPLLTQNADFTQLEYTMRELYNKYGKDEELGFAGNPDFAPMTRHDDIVTPAKFMEEVGNPKYNESMVKVAKNYDFTKTFLESGLDVVKKMKADLDNKTGVAKLQLNAKIEALEKFLEEELAINEERIAYKKSKLSKKSGNKSKDGVEYVKNIKVNLIGVTELKREKSVPGSNEATTVTVKPDETQVKKSNDDILIESAMEADEGLAFDTEFMFNKDNKIVYELAYQTAEGVPKVVKIARNTDKTKKITEEEYYSADDIREWKDAGISNTEGFAKKYPDYKTLEKVNAIVTDKSAVLIEEAIETMLKDMDGKKLVGFNTKGDDSDAEQIISMLKANDATELANQFKAKIAESIDMHQLIKNYRIDSTGKNKGASKGTQSEVATVLGVDMSNIEKHAAEGDIAMLEAIVSKIANAENNGVQLTDLLDTKGIAASIIQEQARSTVLAKFRKTVQNDPTKAVKTLIADLVNANINIDQADAMQKITANDGIEWEIGTSEEFSITKATNKKNRAKIILGNNVDTLSESQEILDRIGHELEHANSATLIDNLSKQVLNGKGKESEEAVKAYNKIVAVLKKLDESKSTLKPGTRLHRVLVGAKTEEENEIKDSGEKVSDAEKKRRIESRQVAELVAVVAGETAGSEQLVQEIKNQNLLDSLIDRAIASVKYIIAMVRKQETLEITEDLNISQLLQAVEQIHRSGLATINNTTNKVNKSMNYEAEAKQQDGKINKKEMAQELRDRLTNLANGRKLPAFEAILNKIKDC